MTFCGGSNPGNSFLRGIFANIGSFDPSAQPVNAVDKRVRSDPHVLLFILLAPLGEYVYEPLIFIKKNKKIISYHFFINVTYSERLDI